MGIASQLCIWGLHTTEDGKQGKLQRAGNQVSAFPGLTLERREAYLGGELEMNFCLICQALLYLGPCLSQGAATGRGLLDLGVGRRALAQSYNTL